MMLLFFRLLWSSIFIFVKNVDLQLPGQLLIRLQNCQHFPPPANVITPNNNSHNCILLKLLQRLQFKMGQIELQVSQGTQFYSV